MSVSRFRNVLVSVSDKTGLADFLKFLALEGARIVSTGGTAQHLREQGLEIVDISEQTNFPEVMDGRVKTLHPRVHMALLARANVPSDLALLKSEGLEPFDLVVVNLYPFEEKLRLNLSEPEQIEFIDIGGPSLLRAAAKSFERLCVICDPSDYEAALAQGLGDHSWRKHLAAKVFAHVSAYDGMIAEHLGAGLGGKDWTFAGRFQQSLRYGENPHQAGFWYRSRGRHLGLHDARVLHGKELSYNNLLDLDAAVQCVQDHREPCVVAVKHTNPCGVALGPDIGVALRRALGADPVSVFGGIVALNRTLTLDAAEQLAKIFLECVVAPKIETAALALLTKKANLRILEWPEIAERSTQPRLRSVLGGVLVQDRDVPDSWSKDWKVIGHEPTSAIQADLLLAWNVAARLKSNAIAVVSAGQTVGLGMGQVNRVDAVVQALKRWHEFHSEIKDVVLASDAFFPFPDSIDEIAKAGIKWVIQPGGSLRDQEVFTRAQESGMNLVLTGRRHFNH